MRSSSVENEGRRGGSVEAQEACESEWGGIERHVVPNLSHQLGFESKISGTHVMMLPSLSIWYCVLLAPVSSESPNVGRTSPALPDPVWAPPPSISNP